LAGATLLSLALKLLTGIDILNSDRLGAFVWTRVRPYLKQAVQAPASLQPVAIGLL